MICVNKKWIFLFFKKFFKQQNVVKITNEILIFFFFFGSMSQLYVQLLHFVVTSTEITHSGAVRGLVTASTRGTAREEADSASQLVHVVRREREASDLVAAEALGDESAASLGVDAPTITADTSELAALSGVGVTNTTTTTGSGVTG